MLLMPSPAEKEEREEWSRRFWSPKEATGVRLNLEQSKGEVCDTSKRRRVSSLVNLLETLDRQQSCLLVLSPVHHHTTNYRPLNPPPSQETHTVKWVISNNWMSFTLQNVHDHIPRDKHLKKTKWSSEFHDVLVGAFSSVQGSLEPRLQQSYCSPLSLEVWLDYRWLCCQWMRDNSNHKSSHHAASLQDKPPRTRTWVERWAQWPHFIHHSSDGMGNHLWI